MALIQVNASPPSGPVTMLAPVRKLGMSRGLDLQPQEPARVRGWYQWIAASGTPIGTAVLLEKGQQAPRSPRGATWHLEEDWPDLFADGGLGSPRPNGAHV